MLDVRQFGRKSRHHWQPWPLVPPPCMGSHCDYHGYHSCHAHCTHSVCHVPFSLCPPSAGRTVPTTPAAPTLVSHVHPAQCKSLTITSIAEYNVPHRCISHRTRHVCFTHHIRTPSILNQTTSPCPARRTKGVALTVPIVHALWCTCTGSIPAGSADRGHVSARQLNRRD